MQTTETYDVVNQMSVVWVDQIHKWVMFYGGGMSKLPTFVFPACGVLEVFTGPDCASVAIGNGAVRMRTADDPWGPWSPPQDVLVGGVPNATPLQGQYVPGGVLHFAGCTVAGCAVHSGRIVKGKTGGNGVQFQFKRGAGGSLKEVDAVEESTLYSDKRGRR